MSGSSSSQYLTDNQRRRRDELVADSRYGPRHPSVPEERYRAQMQHAGETRDQYVDRLRNDPHVQAARERCFAKLRTVKPRQMPRDPNPNRDVPRDDAAFCSACWQAPDACDCPTPEHWETAR